MRTIEWHVENLQLLHVENDIVEEIPKD